MLIRELDLITNKTVSRSIFENQTYEQYKSILTEFYREDIKIIIGIFDTNTTAKLFCAIYKFGKDSEKMYGKSYQWIIVGSYSNELQNLELYAKNTDCTTKEIIETLNGTLQTRVVEYSHDYEEIRANLVNKKNNNKNKNDSKKNDIKMNAFDNSYHPIFVFSVL